MVFIEHENRTLCSGACGGDEIVNLVYACVYDPETDSLGNLCSFSWEFYYILWGLMIVLVILLGFLLKCINRWHWIPQRAKRVQVLNLYFEETVKEAPDNNITLKLTKNSVDLIFGLTHVVQLVVGAYFALKTDAFMNAFGSIFVTLFFAPAIAYAVEMYRPNLDVMYSTLTSLFELDDEIRVNDVFEAAFLTERRAMRKRMLFKHNLWYPWKTSFLILCFLGSLCSLTFPWVTHEFNRGYLTSTVNHEVFWVATYVGFFLSTMILIFMFIGTMGMSIYTKKLDARTNQVKVDLEMYYSPLSQYFMLAGYHCTIFIDETGGSGGAHGSSSSSQGAARSPRVHRSRVASPRSPRAHRKSPRPQSTGSASQTSTMILSPPETAGAAGGGQPHEMLTLRRNGKLQVSSVEDQYGPRTYAPTIEVESIQ